MRPWEPGIEHAITYRVPAANLVHRVFPGVPVFEDKPPVMATAWMAGLCEWPAMEAQVPYLDPDEYCLGSGVDVRHRDGVVPGTTLTVHARCVTAVGPRSGWEVTVLAGGREVARAYCRFSVVNRAAYLARLGEPAETSLATTDH
jgi:predicted thioesterase